MQQDQTIAKEELSKSSSQTLSQQRHKGTPREGKGRKGDGKERRENKEWGGEKVCTQRYSQTQTLISPDCHPLG